MRLLKTSLLAATVLTAGLSAATQAQANPTFIYKVKVVTSFGTKFEDCYTFHDGVLEIAGLGASLIYTPAPTMPKFYYTAVTSPAVAESLGYSFAFAGFKRGTSTSGAIHAVGADNTHNSYTVNGIIDASCSTSSAAQADAYEPAK